MNQTITKNDKSIKILNKLIANGFYNGYVGPEKFELFRNHFPNNHRLIGILNDKGKYDVKFDYINRMSIAAKVLLGFGILMTGISFLKGDWRILLASAVTGLAVIMDFKVTERNEIKRFTNKFLEFEQAESE